MSEQIDRSLTWPCCLRVVSVSLSQHRHCHNSSDFLMTSGQPCAPCPGTCPCLRWDEVQTAEYIHWYVSVIHHQYQHLCRAKSHWNPHQGMLPHRLVAGTVPTVLLLRAKRSKQHTYTNHIDNMLHQFSSVTRGSKSTREYTQYILYYIYR